MPLLWTESARRPSFDAVVIAREPNADERVLGLSLRERARRVCERAGARRVYVVDQDNSEAGLDRWWRLGGTAAVVVVWADDQLVHMPLIEPLLDAGAERAVAVTPGGAFAGAALARGADATRQLLGTPEDTAKAWMAGADAAVAVEHGEVARHPAATAMERRAAGRWLEQIVHKPQDGPVTRWLYRPVSVRLSRLLVRTPITPNQVSLVVAVLGAVGIYFTARYDYDSVLLGSVIVLAAAYIDGCDGEIARLKLRVSKAGAWIDTLTDEATTVAYMAALGYHNYLRHPEPWVAWSIAVGLVTYVSMIAAIYYYLIVVHGSANSQDYVDKLEVVPGREPGTRALRPVEGEALTGFNWVAAQIMRRDFINWGAVALAALHWTHVGYGIMLAGGVGGFIKIVAIDHRRLRGQIREVRS